MLNTSSINHAHFPLKQLRGSATRDLEPTPADEHSGTLEELVFLDSLSLATHRDASDPIGALVLLLAIVGEFAFGTVSYGLGIIFPCF